jgi:hypothetical protein
MDSLFIFINLFWSSKFYFEKFDPNWSSIDFDFLSKGGIERKVTSMKKAKKIVGILDS